MPNEIQQFETEGPSFRDKALSLDIRDQATFEDADAFLTFAKKRLKQVVKFWEDPISRAREALRSVQAQRDKVLSPYSEIESIVKPKISAYLESERKRIEQEQGNSERVAESNNESEIIDAAAKAEAEGRKDEAEAILSQADIPVVLPPVQTTPSVGGLYEVEMWKFRIKNPALVPAEYWVIDEVKIGRVVRALKGSARIPGVEAYPVKMVRKRIA